MQPAAFSWAQKPRSLDRGFYFQAAMVGIVVWFTMGGGESLAAVPNEYDKRGHDPF